MAPAEKIDVHAHFLPPKYREVLAANGHTYPDGMPGIPPWSEEDHLDMMSTLNISKSILSISSPGTHVVPGNDKMGTKVTRNCNTYAADLKKRMPDKFGFWASLPLPDVQASLTEIAFAFDELSADGVTVETNHHGQYLGDKVFDPVFDELNRRHATVFIHPTTPCMASGEMAVPLANLPRPMFEFLFDTARAVINLFLSGTVTRCPNIKFIIPHCGGTFPPLINRFSTQAPYFGLADLNPPMVKEILNKQFFFDTAGFAIPGQLNGLLEYVSVERILYGSDYPFTKVGMAKDRSDEHDEYLPKLFPDPLQQKALCIDNAKKLLGE